MNAMFMPKISRAAAGHGILFKIKVFASFAEEVKRKTLGLKTQTKIAMKESRTYCILMYIKLTNNTH